MKNVQDDNYLHLAVSSSFAVSDHIHPVQVYLTIVKKGESDHLAYNSYGKFNPTTGLYQITFDFSRGMEHLNGEY